MHEFAYLAAPLLLAGLILVVEFARYRRGHLFDALRLASVLYFLAYAIVPVQLHFADLSDFRGGAWNWAVQFEANDPRFIYGSLLGLLGYLGLLTGYALCHHLFRRGIAPSTAITGTEGQRDLLRIAVVLAGFGGAALAVYTVSIGGVGPLILQAAAFRTAPPVITRWAFLKNLAPVVVSATMIIAGLYALSDTPGRRRRLGWLLAATWLVSFVLLFHRAARLPLIAFLVTLPVARALRRGRADPLLLGGGAALFVLLVLFGKGVFLAGSSAGTLHAQWSTIRDDALYAVNSILLEFSFPFITASSAVTVVPAVVPLRWFSDFGIAILYLVPQRISGLTPPPTVSAVNSELLGGRGVPVDVTSLGYYSAGVPGLVVTTIAFGMFLFLVDRLVRRHMSRESPLFVLGISLLFYAGFTLMYGDPQMALESGFPLLISVGAVVVGSWLLRFLTTLTVPPGSAVARLPHS